MVRQLVRYPRRTGKFYLIYIRVSKGEKIQKSMPGQVTISMERGAQDGLELATWVGDPFLAEDGTVIAEGGIFRDEKSRGVRREGLHALLQAMDDNPEIAAVYFWDYRRVWGQPEQYNRINARAVQAGYRLVDSHGVNHTSETAMEEFVAAVRSSASAMEIRTVGERSKEMNTQKVKAGQVVTRLPLGGRSVKYFENNEARTRHEIDPHDIAIARRIFKLYSQSSPTYRICELFVSEGVRTSEDIRKGRPSTWKPDAMRNILDNRWYIGTMDYNRTGTVWELDPVTGDKIRRVRARHESEHVEGPSPLGVALAEDPNDPDSVAAAIDLWQRCQEIRDRKGRERPARQYFGVLDYLVVCGRCGKQMQRLRTSHKSRVTGKRGWTFNFICPYRANIGTGCRSSHSMSELKIFAEMRTLAQARAEDGVRSNMSRWRAPSRSTGAMRRALKDAESRQAEAEAALERVHAAYEGGAYELDEFDARKRKAKVAVETAQDAVASARKALDEPADTPAELRGETVKAWLAFLDLLQDARIPVDVRRAEAEARIEKIEIDHPRVTVWLREAGSTAT